MEDFLFEIEKPSDLSSEPAIQATDSRKNLPLPARMRPTSFDEYVGQNHLLDKGKLLRRAIDADRFA